MSFAGRFEPRELPTGTGDRRIALEVHDVAIEYGAKPRAAEPASRATVDVRDDDAAEDDIPL